MENIKEIEIKLTKEWVDALDKSFEKAKKDIKVDGFRKGAIPKDVYFKKFGIESLYDEAINIVMNEAYTKALDESKLIPIIQPKVDVTGISDSNIILKFTITEKPVVKLGKYKNLGIKCEKATVTKKEVDDEVQSLRTRYAENVIKEGKIEKGDIAKIDFKGIVDGKELEGGSGEDFPLEIGSKSFIPGFEDGLIGKSSGDKLTLNLTFPENYVEHLKNKPVTFEVVIKEVSTKELPKIDKEFFKDLGYSVKDEEEFLKKVKEDILAKKTQEIENKFIDECLEEASKNMKVSLSDEIINDEVHRMIHQYEDQLKMQGMDLNKYLEYTNSKIEDLEKQMKPEAEKRIKYRYLLEEIAKTEKFEFSKEEVDKKIEEFAKNYNMNKEALLNAFGSREVIEYDMKMHKAIEFLKENN